MTTPSNKRAAGNLRVVADRLLGRLDQLCLEVCRLLRENVPAYQTEALISDEDLLVAIRAQALIWLRALGSGSADTASASLTGRQRAEQGVPLSDVMSAYREGARYFWGQVADSLDELELSRRDMLAAAASVWQYQSEYTQAMAVSYRAVVTEQLIRRDQERSALVGGLLDGRLPAQMTAWDAARLLGLPELGWFVVVAIGVNALDHASFPAIENALGADGFTSAWRVELDMQVGVVVFSASARFARLLQSLTDRTTTRVGVSPVYDNYPPPGTALNYARAALRATTAEERVIAFDTNPYAVAAITDPQTMDCYARSVLGSLNTIDRADKELLLDTFREWLASGGSITDSARLLCCHPNTVRYRLRRLKDHTGRDVTNPREAAELRLAVEADQRLNQTY